MYNLTLQVADMSGDGLTSTASAIITLEDVNDNAPSFTREEVPSLSPHPQPLHSCPPFPSLGPVGTSASWRVEAGCFGAGVLHREHRDWIVISEPSGVRRGSWEKQRRHPSVSPKPTCS